MRLKVVASLTLLLAAAAVAAPLSKPAALAIMHQRHEGMEAVGKTNKILLREITADAPNIAAVRSAANAMASLSAKSARWFPKGTGPELGNTGAKTEIWQRPDDFAARLRDFQSASKAIQIAAAQGNLAAVKANYANLGKSCKACHDIYRSDMHH